MTRSPAATDAPAAAVAPATAPDIPDPSRLSAPDAAYRVRVSLGTGPQQQALRARLQPGMQVQASIQAEKRTLLEWAIEPLAALQAAAQ